MGVQYNEIPTGTYPIFLIAGAFPVLFYKGLQNLSSGISIMLYVFGILPCYHGVCTCNPIDVASFYGYAITFIFCGILFFITDSLYFLKNNFVRQHKFKISISCVEVITIIMLAVLVITYHGQMSFVNIFVDSELLYERRAENSGLSVASIVLYFQQWLSNGFLPFLLLVYLRRRNTLKIACCVLGYLLIFMINMQKATFLMPFILIIVYIIVSINKTAIRNYFYPTFLAVVSAVSSTLLYYIDESKTAFTVAAIFIMRTVCVEGWLCDIYVSFFEKNPFTYFTHINIINYLTGAYPYEDSIGRTVTHGSQNANAFFLLMDGVAGCGVMGVIIVALIFVIVKAILNSICLKYDKNICFIVFFPAIISLINVSMFTAILTCGLLVLYILFMYTDAPMLQYKHME